MTENISDRNGRALEYSIVKHLFTRYKVKLTPQAIKDQGRDEHKFDELPLKLKKIFIDSSVKIGGWLSENWEINGNILLDRLGDDKAKEGDVTDIRLIFPDKSRINLSIKHNHDAVKHQRPGALAQQCGFPKKSTIDKEYRLAFRNVKELFLCDADKINPNAITFNDLRNVDSDFIFKSLYNPVCNLVEDFINEHCNDEEHSKHLFCFLVGTINFYKVIVTKELVKILAFSDIPLPKSVTATQTSDHYVDLLFSNEWKFSMRLHTASSGISGVSLKFDTRAANAPIPTAAQLFHQEIIL